MCKIPVPTPWNVDLFEELLDNYHDQNIVKFLRYGWPLEVTHVDRPEGKIQPINQTGARCNPAKLNTYLAEEIDRGSVIGPFCSNPLGKEAKFSPLDAIPKRDSSDLRVIMNLSYPHDDSAVNAGLDKDYYLGEEIKLRYPSMEDLVRIIRKKGRGALLFKRDLFKCYRFIYMDPGSIHLLGFVVDKQVFFDVVLSMGLKVACLICQKITDALMYIYRKLSFEGVNYLDDLGGAEVRRRAWEAFRTLGWILEQLGIRESKSKAAPPSTVMTFLGVTCNSETFMLSITPERLEEILQLVAKWLDRSSASLHDVQSLAGKLNFVCFTVRSGRVFVARILAFLRQFKGKPGIKELSEEIRADLRWWNVFLKDFNGVTMFPETRWIAPDKLISTDSCLSGCGGWSEGEYFHCDFPAEILSIEGITINELECLAVVIAIKVWKKRIVNKNLIMQCDNLSTCQVINKGNAKNAFTQKCLREVVWVTAKNNTWVKMQFVPGVSNRFSDLLSRWNLDSKYKEAFFRETEGCRKREIPIFESYFNFDHLW